MLLNVESQNTDLYTDYVNSPLGLIECKATDKGVVQVIFCGEQLCKPHSNHITQDCHKQLKAYFKSELQQFKIPLDLQGTDFQKLVWQSLLTIPYGKTVTYLDIAKKVNNPKGSQAVGGAIGRNPISILVPCHRVLGSNGALTGYAGGIERKMWLLQHEGLKLKEKELEKLDIHNVINLRQSKTEFLK